MPATTRGGSWAVPEFPQRLSPEVVDGGVSNNRATRAFMLATICPATDKADALQRDQTLSSSDPAPRFRRLFDLESTNLGSTSGAGSPEYY
jgi:hypothetical protein